MVNVYFSFASGCWSPMMRLGHRLVTLISISLDPVFRADVTSGVKDGFQRISDNILPFNVTWANSRTRPRSRTTFEAGRSHLVRQIEPTYAGRGSGEIFDASMGRRSWPKRARKT